MPPTRSLRALALGASLTVATGLGLVAAPQTARADVSVAPASGSFTLIGRGFGHGRGMSQYGAMAAAQAGQTWQQIIGFYYPNTTLQSRPDTPIRVGLSGHVGSTVSVKAEANLVATDDAGQTLILPTTDPSGRGVASWEVNLPSAGASNVATLWEHTTSGVRVAYASTVTGKWSLTAADGSLVALTSSGASAGTLAGTYSGTRNGSSMVPVLTTTLENYTRQVVPWESIGSWPVQALAAQAVAARSYAAYYQSHPRSTYYDICDTTACQVFGGLGNETSNSLAGVRASAGQVLTSNGAPILAEFASSNGGQIVGTSLAWQVAKADPNEARLAPSLNTWTASVTAAKLQAAYPAVGTPTSLAVTTRDGLGMWGGRVGTLTLTGTTGSVQISADALRSLIGTSVAKSTYFTLVPGAASLARDVTGDGQPDLLALSAAGHLTLATASATTGTPTDLGAGWSGFAAVFGAEHMNSDRQADVFALTSTGDLRLYTATGTGKVAYAAVVAKGLTGYRSFVTLSGVHGSRPSVFAVRVSDGALVRFDSTSSTAVTATPTVVTPSGFSGASVTNLFGSGDFTGDGRTDLLVRTTSGTLVVYPGNGAGGFGSGVQFGRGFGGFRDVVSVGDVTGDGLADLVARRSDGTTVRYASAGGGRLGASTTLSTSADVLLN